MGLKLTLIADNRYPYVLDYGKEHQNFGKETLKTKTPLALIQKTLWAATLPLRLIADLFSAIAQGAYVTLSYSWVSFKHIVLGYYGSMFLFRPPRDIHLAAFKVAYWILAMGWCFATSSAKIFYDKQFPHSPRQLYQYATDEMNVAHIRTKEVNLDASGVPKNIQVASLLKIFDEINFEDDKSFNYVSPKACCEGPNPYSKTQLLDGLKKFVENVQNRTAFIGTPPSYDTPRLMSFYQQIEDAIRLSIHCAEEKLERFAAENGKDLTTYNQIQKQQYLNLVEDKLRIVIDMAIAGKHCGARYMGEAMTTYYYFHQEDAFEGVSFQDCLIELLAQKRRKIAEAEIQTWLGFDTHPYNKYMSQLGSVLGIPGTNNIVEHLDTDLDRHVALTRFFKVYTVDCIIETIQKKLKESEKLRAKLFDWLQGQVNDWNVEEYRVSQEEIEAIFTIIVSERKPVEVKKQAKGESSLRVDAFFAFINYLKKNIDIKEKIDAENLSWDDFLLELFASDAAIDWRKEHFVYLSEMNPINRQVKVKQEIDAIKKLFSAEKHSESLLADLKSWILNNGKQPPKDLFLVSDELPPPSFEELKEAIKNEKKAEILKIVPFAPETLSRLFEIQDKKKLKSQIAELAQNRRDLERRTDFLDKLQMTEIVKNGLSKEILEWLLVPSILLPQEG